MDRFWLQRLRLAAGRRRRTTRLLAAATALLAGLVPWAATRSTLATKAAWGATTEVLVAVEPLHRGDPIGPRVTLRAVPVGLVPEDAVDPRDEDTTGFRAARRISRGAILVAADVADGRRAVADPEDVLLRIRLEDAAGALPGDRVMLAAEGLVLAAEALVVEADAEGITVAVPVGVAAAVAAGQRAAGGLSLLRRP